jgi:hypothetical protein
MLRRLDPSALRAAWWTVRALARARRELSEGKLHGIALAPPPPLPAEAVRGVHAVLRRREASCLERSLVLQRWLAAQGRPLDVVIGVTTPADFRAHAWLEGEPVEGSIEFDELVRVSP